MNEGNLPYSVGSARVLFVTDKAIKVLTADLGPIFLPKSAIHADCDLVVPYEVGDETDDLEVCMWLAERRGWI